ncbi:wax ester/triacylglycerol synthase domain-containing protein, partial [Streptomyces sp. NPDC059627]
MTETADLLAPLDLAFWNIESEQHPMHLGALGVFSAHSPTAGAHAAGRRAARGAPRPGRRQPTPRGRAPGAGRGG